MRVSFPGRTFLPVLVVVLAGCLNGLDPQEEAGGAVVREGSREAVAVLAFLNGPEATIEVLVGTVHLRPSAATSIFDHVRGPNGVLEEPGTETDGDALDTIAELRGLPAVGDATINHVTEFLFSRMPGYVVVEGVSFDESEAERVLQVVARASREQLDDDARVDTRAVDGILLRRPFLRIADIADVPWVGGEVMTQLRDYAPIWAAPEPSGCEPMGNELAPAAAYDQLLWLATDSDLPFARVVPLQAAGCSSFEDADEQGMLAEGLWCAAFGRCDNPSIVHQIARPQPGTSAFSALLGETQARLEQLVDGGQWDPSDSDEGRELYEGRNELLATLRAPIDDSPDSFIEFQVAIDAGECSELAVAVLDVRTGAILLVHRLPLC